MYVCVCYTLLNCVVLHRIKFIPWHGIHFIAHRTPSVPQLLQASRLYQNSNKISASLYECASLSYCLYVSIANEFSQVYYVPLML